MMMPSPPKLPRALARASVVLLCLFIIAAPSALHAAPAADPKDVQTAWRLLDYMAVDYGGAVERGRVKSASQYAEMTEFAGSVASQLATLPSKPRRSALLAGAARLQRVNFHAFILARVVTLQTLGKAGAG